MEKRSDGLKTGFVPTMGALHRGHLQLIDIAGEKSDLTVCSIFINPTQFNDMADFRKYPSTLENDIHLLEQSGTDILFLPSMSAIYPSGTETLEQYELDDLDHLLEGAFRPGHFQGVCQVMSRLLKAVQPQFLFMGQKDYQQCMVVQKLLEDLDLPVELIACPTIREPDGLAMSSRNTRLGAEDREKAGIIYQILLYIKAGLTPGNLLPLKKDAAHHLELSGFRIDYLEIVESGTLKIVDNWDGRTELVALVAVFLGDVRLIDNMLLSH